MEGIVGETPEKVLLMRGAGPKSSITGFTGMEEELMLVLLFGAFFAVILVQVTFPVALAAGMATGVLSKSKPIKVKVSYR